MFYSTSVQEMRRDHCAMRERGGVGGATESSVRRATQRSGEAHGEVEAAMAHLAPRGGRSFALRHARVRHVGVLHARENLRKGALAVERCSHPTGRRLGAKVVVCAQVSEMR